MKRTLTATILLLATSAAVAQTAPPHQGPPPGTDGAEEQPGGSLARATAYSSSSAQDGNPFAVKPPDPKRIKKHDLLTVIINEQSSSQSKDTTDLKRTADMNALLSQYIQITSQFQVKGVTPANPPQVTLQTDRNFKGEGSTDRSDTMNARVQAEVIDVQPNGTLVIQATKNIKNDDEEQHFTLTGFLRAEDVTPDNSVLSTQLAHLTLEKMTKGAAHDTSSRGWLQRFLDALNPF